VTYTYDALNRVASVTEPGPVTTTFAYADLVDGAHDRKTTTYPGGTVQTELVDQAGRLASIGAVRSATTLTGLSYTYEESANDPGTPLRTSVTDALTGHVTGYDYDGSDRLVEAVTDDGVAEVDSHLFDYDDAGNRNWWNANGTVTSYTHNAANQMVTSTTNGATTTYHYDDAGNQTGSTAGQQLDYNTLNQTTSARKATGTSTQTMGYLGASQYTRTLYGATGITNSVVLGVIAHGGVSYTRTPDGTLVSRRLTTSRAYFLHDGLGSTIALVQGDGTVRNRYAYSPYGQTTTTCPTGSCVSNPFQYTGAEHDETTGLYKIGHRYYQPDHGRWTQPDPLGNRTNMAMPTEAHPYLYVGCNPTNYTDPSGLASRYACYAGSTSLAVLALAFAPLPFVGASYTVAAITVQTICYVRGY
jgi:RHS repeat-associated protein